MAKLADLVRAFKKLNPRAGADQHPADAAQEGKLAREAGGGLTDANVIRKLGTAFTFAERAWDWFARFDAELRSPRQQEDFLDALTRARAKPGETKDEAARKAAESLVSASLVQPIFKRLRESNNAAAPFGRPTEAERPSGRSGRGLCPEAGFVPALGAHRQSGTPHAEESTGWADPQPRTQRVHNWLRHHQLLRARLLPKRSCRNRL